MLKPTVLSSALCVLFLTVSCKCKCKGTTHTVTIKTNAQGDLYVGDSVSNNSESDLHYMSDDRIKWVNDTSSIVYVCFVPSDTQPFEAVVWAIPANRDYRNSGKIRERWGEETYYNVNSSPAACINLKTSELPPPLSNPKIKISQ
jgi:hypothetical protein